MRLHNKKHTRGRKKWSTALNNWSNRTDINPRGTMTPEGYALYLKDKKGQKNG